MKYGKTYVPVLVFLLLAMVFYAGLGRDTERLDSPLIGRAMPAFSMPDLNGDTRTAADLRGEIRLLNVWATWCIACRVEHPVLVRIAEQEGIALVGLNYKDDADAARQWLRERGDPYRFSIRDEQGSLGLDLGVYGAPETYLIDADGIIRDKHVGVVDERVWQDILLPRIQALRGAE